MNVIITGASRGIGYALVSEFLKREASVLAVSRDLSVWESENDPRLTLSEADLGNQQSIDSLIDSVRKQFDKVDILINNAGYLVKGSLLDAFSPEVDNMWRVNVLGPGYFTAGLIGMLSASGAGHVVNISSMAGWQGSSKFAGIGFYSATKSAVATLTECMAVEYADSGVAFNSLAIGAVDTEMLQLAFPGYRAPVNPAQMAKFVADFAIGAGKVMSGRVVPVTITNPT